MNKLRRILGWSSGVLFGLGVVALGVVGTGSNSAAWLFGVLLLALSTVVVLGGIRSVPVGRPSAPAVIAFAALAGWLAWRASVSEVRYLARNDLIAVACAALAYQAVAFRFTTLRARERLGSLLVILALANLPMALYQFVEDPSFTLWAPLGFSRAAADRSAAGFFVSENHYAFFLLFPALLSLSRLVLGTGSATRRLLQAAAFVLISIGLIISTSRAGLAAFGVGFLTFAVLASLHLVRHGDPQVRFLWKVGAVVVAILVLGGSSIALTIFKERYDFANDRLGLRSSLDMRLSMWERGLEQAALSPVTGTGARSYEYLEHQFRSFDDARWPWFRDFDLEAEFAHNEIVQILAEYGWIGLSLLVVAFLAHLATGLGRYRRLARDCSVPRDRSNPAAAPRSLEESGRFALHVAALAALVAMAADLPLDFNLHIGANILSVAIVLGMIANPGGGGEHPPRRGPGRALHLGLALATTAAAVFLLARGTVWLRAEYHVFLAKQHESRLEPLLALGDFQLAGSLDPENHYIPLGTAGACLTLAEDEELALLQRIWLERAIEALEEVRRLYPRNPYGTARLAETLGRLGDTRTADSLFTEGLSWAPTHRVLLYARAEHLVRSGRLEEARSAYQEFQPLVNWRERDHIQEILWAIEKALAGTTSGGPDDEAPDPEGTDP